MSRFFLKIEVPALPDYTPAAFPAFSNGDGTGGTRCIGSIIHQSGYHHLLSFTNSEFSSQRGLRKTLLAGTDYPPLLFYAVY